MIYILTALSAFAFLVMFQKDTRYISNSFLLLTSILLLYVSLIVFSYEHVPLLHTILLLGLLLVPLLFFAFGLFLIGNGIVVLKKEGRSLSNTLPILMGVGVVLYIGLLIFAATNQMVNITNQRLFLLLNYTFLFSSIVFGMMMFIFFAVLLYAMIYLSIPRNKNYDFIIIHGSGLIDGEVVPPLLASRIEKGIQLYHLAEKETVKLIASGGQGEDEKLSEAQAIYNYLIEKGIPKDKIIREDQSTTTYENLKFSKALAQKEMTKPIYVFVSNNYHVFRVAMYTLRLKMRVYGVGSKTAGYYLPSAFIREFIAIVAKFKRPIITLLIAFVILLLITR